MLLISRALFYLVAPLIFSGLSAAERPDVLDVDITLRRDGGSIVAIINNNSAFVSSIVSPIVLWQPGIGGFEFMVWGMNGVALVSCGTRSYNHFFQKLVDLKPSQVMKSSFKISEIEDYFCMPPNKYFVQVIFRNEISGEVISKDVISNPIIIEMGREK